MKSALFLVTTFLALQASSQQWVTYNPPADKANGKQIVLLSGDEEYRSEEGLPQLGKILSQRHGFKCTVLFSLNPTTGEIDPNMQKNEPGMEALDSADLCVMLLRFRQWPDAQMKHFVDYLQAGKPIIALRTSTHAFSYDKDSTSPYKRYSWSGGEWAGGFGRQVLGETWVNHWGNHKHEATRGVIEEAAKSWPIFNGVKDIFVGTDVYEAHPPADARILVWGQVAKGMNPTDGPADYKKKTASGVEQGVNDPMQAVAWLRSYKNESGRTNEILATTMGAATDLENEGLRRLVVNAAFHLLHLKVPPLANVEVVGEYKPTFYGFNEYKKGVKPADHEWKH